MVKQLTIIIIASYFLLIGCKKENSNIVQTINVVDVEDKFNSDLKTKPKLFLNFWSGMTLDEKSKVMSSLIKEGKITLQDGVTEYISGDYGHKIEFNFNNNKLESISLLSNIDEIYPQYQKKYNLPSLVSKNLLYQCYAENNQNYEPITTYKKIGQGNKLYQIPNALIDLSISLKSRIYFDVNNEKYNVNYFQNSFYKNEFSAEKDDVFLIFRQNLTKEDLPYTNFSLYSNKDAMSAQQSINGEGFGNVNNPGTGITMDIIRKNSRIVTVYKAYSLEKSITYISRKDYNNRKKVIESNTKLDSLENIKEKNKLNERKVKSLNEI